MAIDYTLEHESDFLRCVVYGDVTPATNLEVLEVVLGACYVTDQDRALIDVSGIRKGVGPTEKLIWADNAEQTLRRFKRDSGIRPRVAIFGGPPLIRSYKPASEQFEARDVPIRVFDSLEEATDWLTSNLEK